MIYHRSSFAETIRQGTLCNVSRPYRRKDRWDAPRPWRVEYTDPLTGEPGDRHFRTEKEAWAFHARVTDDREALRTGSLTRRQVAMGARGLTPVAESIAAYLEHLNARGVSPAYHKASKSVLNRLHAATGWTVVKDISMGGVEMWLTLFGPNTARQYANQIKGWCNWLVDTDHLPESPLSRLKLPRAGERMRKRAFTDAEFQSLITCPDIAPHRRLWYWFGGRMGIRHAEIGRLKWEHVDFEHGCLRMPGTITKNKRDAVLPIPSLLLATLRELRQAPAMKIIRNITKPENDTWRADLRRAGIPLDTEHGRAVLSSLRRTFITALARKGVPLTTARVLARHADINLTAKIYTEVLPSEMRDAVEKLG